MVRTTYEYDQQDRLLHLSHVQTNPFSILAAYSYQYDALGRISYLTSNDGTTEYSYDAAGQLATADYNFANTSTEPGDESFSFDANGNANGAAFTPGDFNRPESDGAWTYEYDEEGNRTAKISTVDADERFEYAWDARNRLIEVRAYDAEGLVTQVTTQAYDHLNRWVRTENSPAVGPAEARRFVYDGDQIILALDGNEQPTARYLWGPAVDLLLAEDQLGESPKQYWPLGDHQNSVRDLAERNTQTGVASSRTIC